MYGQLRPGHRYWSWQNANPTYLSVCVAKLARVRLADMNLDAPVGDERRIAVVANGLPLWHVSQWRSMPPSSRLLRTQPRRDTYPELDGARCCRLVVVGVEVGGSFGREAAAVRAPAC